METQELINKLNDTQDAVRYAVSAIDDIKAKLSGSEGTPATVAKPTEAEPTATEAGATEGAYSLEQVRSTLADLSRKGYTEAVRGLLRKHGASKLSDIDPAKYVDLMADAKELNNG